MTSAKRFLLTCLLGALVLSGCRCRDEDVCCQSASATLTVKESDCLHPSVILFYGTCKPAADTGFAYQCTCAQATFTAANCSWLDGDKCSGFQSAYCYQQCAGYAGACFTDCEAALATQKIDDGTKAQAPDCTITLECPVP